MSMTEPLLPHPDDGESAAESPVEPQDHDVDEDADLDATVDGGAVEPGSSDDPTDVPVIDGHFRTPTGASVDPARSENS